MDNKSKQPEGFSVDDAKKLAQSQAGQKLYSALQQSHGTQLQNAMDQVSSGNLQEAKNALTEILNTPEFKAFLQQMGGPGNG